MTHRTVLVPDLDGELALALNALEVWARFMGEDYSPTELGVDATEAAAALSRLYTVIAPLDLDEQAEERRIAAGQERQYTDRVLGPDGRYEYAPMHRVQVWEADLATLRGFSAHLAAQAADPAGVVAEALEELVEAYWSEAYPNGALTPTSEMDAEQPLLVLGRLLGVLGEGVGASPEREELLARWSTLSTTPRPDRGDCVDHILDHESERLLRAVTAGVVGIWHDRQDQNLAAWARL